MYAVTLWFPYIIVYNNIQVFLSQRHATVAQSVSWQIVSPYSLVVIMMNTFKMPFDIFVNILLPAKYAMTKSSNHVVRSWGCEAFLAVWIAKVVGFYPI